MGEMAEVMPHAWVKTQLELERLSNQLVPKYGGEKKVDRSQ